MSSPCVPKPPEILDKIVDLAFGAQAETQAESREEEE
jgi:hypothetical protein